MPRKGRGGRRTGTPGVAYGNRTDLHGSKPLPKVQYHSQHYGDGAAQQAAQAAVPVATAPIQPAPQTPGPPSPGPGSLGDLMGPTARPDEPLTAGLPSGPGPGPEALQMVGARSNPDLDQLRAIYMAHPSPDLRDLIDFMDSQQ